MTKTAFAERIKQNKPLLADGAMGTMLHELSSLPILSCFDELNLTQPQLVQAVHMAYLDAGAEIIETNSFGANRFKLSEYGLGDRVAEVNTAAVAIARAAIIAADREDAYIAGSLGPLGQGIKPYGRLTREEAESAYSEQIEALLDAGIDLLLLETFSNHDELILAVKVAHRLQPDLAIVAQTTFSGDSMTTYSGHGPARVAHELVKAGANIIGVNCGSGPAYIADILQTMHHAVPDARLSVMPNAGFPESVGGRVMYSAAADYFGEYALVFRSLGAQIIGGCCGTTPDHIAAMRTALDDPQRVAPRIQIVRHSQREEGSTTPQGPTQLKERISNGKFTITVEMTPPRSYTVDKLIAEARLLRDAGADLIDVADTPAARMKMSAWAVSHILQSEIGIETVLHFPTRGRNLLRVQGDLLAAHALGLRNLFITMGDPTRIGDYPDAMDTYDIVPSKLINLVKHGMNAGQDMAGNSIGQPTSFTVGCALNMAADDLDNELKVLANKLSAGSDFALGQAVFDPPRIDAFLKRYEEIYGEAFNLPVLMGVIPLYSVRHAQFLHNEVPGISIPDSIFKRLEDAGEDAPIEGVRIAQELMATMRDRVQGAYIIPSYGRYHLASELCNAIASASVSA